MKYNNVCEATFLRRLNRFVAEVEMGRAVERVHVKNTGRCAELLVPGYKVYLDRSGNPDRRTAFDLIGVDKPEWEDEGDGAIGSDAGIGEEA